MTPTKSLNPANRSRRRLLAAATLSPWLAACGGGGEDSAADVDSPVIDEFAVIGSALVGAPATLRVHFRGGAGRIEPTLGPVSSGGTVQTDVLSVTQRFRLIVSRPGSADAMREITVVPGWRNRWRGFEAPGMTGHAVAVVGNLAPLVMGGSRGTGVLSSAIERFDPVSLRFSTLGQMLTGRSEMSALPVGDGQVLVFGGSTSTAQPPFAEIVDARTGATRHGGWMMQPRSRHAAVRLADGRVAAVGGTLRNSIEIWSPASNTWALAGNRMAQERQHATATLLPDGRVLIVGGYTAGASPRFAELFDPGTETFVPVPDGPAERRWLHAAVTLDDGSVLIVGGENDGGALSTVWRFSLATQRFEAQPSLLAPRTVVRAAVGPGDEVLMFGGEEEPDVGLASGEAWRADTRRALPAMPATRAWHTLTRLADGRLLVLGGQHRSDFMRGGHIFD